MGDLAAAGESRSRVKREMKQKVDIEAILPTYMYVERRMGADYTKQLTVDSALTSMRRDFD